VFNLVSVDGYIVNFILKLYLVPVLSKRAITRYIQYQNPLAEKTRGYLEGAPSDDLFDSSIHLLQAPLYTRIAD
jgi:hypothetical protein